MKRFSIYLLCVFIQVTFILFPTTLDGKMKVGEEVLERFQTANPYRGPGVAWEKIFHWPQAGYIAVHFTAFDLAPGDYVEISSPDGKFAYRYKEKGKPVKEKGAKEAVQIDNFWAAHIPGDTAVVKLVAKGSGQAGGFVVDKWAHGFERAQIEAVLSALDEEAEAAIEAVCSADDKEWAKCCDGTEMYNKSKAVCRLLIGGTYACTGWLLGSEGHVVTNNHCIANQTDASNTDFEFMAEGATCATDCANWGACPGTVEADSGTLVKTNTSLDYSLVLLPTNLTSTYGYLQFRNEIPTVGERIYIPQHPNHWGKQLAVNSDIDGPYAKISGTAETPCSGGPGDIGYYADTDGGSSGSPVLGYEDHLVVSLHHCANCPNRGVPIPNIISDLGAALPADAVGASLPQAPTADFSAGQTTVMVGNSVDFSDQSSHNPTSWSWTFEGGTPASSTAQNPTVVYDGSGSFDVTLVATNDLGSDSITKTAYITVTDTPVYCDSSATEQMFEYIAGVQVGDLNNPSAASSYSDFTAMAANLTAGGSVNVTLTPGHTATAYTEYWKIWIDYNYDGDFDDAGEEVFSGSGTTPVTGSFTVPAGLNVVTRMRVSMQFSAFPPPCGTFTYGEVEDYTASITGGGTPPTAQFYADNTTIVAGQSVNFTDQSTENPTSWSWTFAGGSPATSSSQNPTVTYDTAGTYTVTLTAGNAYGGDTETKVDYITVQPAATCIGSVANPGFETGTTSGWTTTGTVTVTTKANTGNYAIDVENQGSRIEQTVTGLCPNTSYTLTAWGKAKSSAGVYLGVSGYGGADLTAQYTTGKWESQSIVFTTGASDTSAVVYFTKTADSRFTGSGDDFTLIKN